MSAEDGQAAGSASRPSLLGMPKAKLAAAVSEVIDRPFRVEQIYRGIYEEGREDFASMTALPAALREALGSSFSIALPETATRHESADGTLKELFRLHDGKTVEAVDIPDGERRTFCLSSQAGCALACRFCVTGFWGAGRNLTAGEIVGQVLALRRRPRPETHGLNLVFMGMGEPLLNLEALEDALMVLFEQISWRRITVSTVGIIPGIEAMAAWPRRPQIAISLHAPDDERRSALMPINKTYPIDDLLAALKRYPLAPKQKITFEYILIHGLNDAPGDADLLARRLGSLPAKVNLIPLNPDPVLGPEMKAPPPARVRAFQARLMARGMVATVRRQRGDDVSAACGQLRATDRAPRGFRRSNLSW